MAEIQRNTSGLIDLQFKYLESIDESDDIKLTDKVDLISKLTNNVRAMASLDLANRKLLASAPEFAKRRHALRLTDANGEDDAAE